MRKKPLTKAERRKIKKRDGGIVDFIQVMTHFFKELPQWIEEMTDPRHQSYIKYAQSDLFFLGLLKNICGVGTMRQMNERFNEENCIRTLSVMSGNGRLDELPDYGTLNHYLSMLSPECLAGVRTLMIRHLIRSKLFNNGRLLSKYWLVAIDGTGLFHFRERHCPHCLVTVRRDCDGNEVRHYYHKVVEAKLVLAENVVLSIGTEFIENEDEGVPKQDCETKAAKRLIAGIKREYPRLPLCLLGDALFATEPVMGLCRENGWKYIFNLKEGGQPNVCADYRYIIDGGGAMLKEGILAEKGTGRFANHVEEVTGKIETFNVFEYACTHKDRNGGEKETRFMWATNMELSARNLAEMITAARKRWKIENEGFNSQKNGIYKIEHINSYNSNAMKNHYLLAQMADILMQLYIATSRLIGTIGQSVKNTSSRLLESFRRHPITDEDVSFINKYTTVRLL